MRTPDLSWSCRHSSTIMHLLECDCLNRNIALHLGGEQPTKGDSTTEHWLTPSWDPPFYRCRERARGRLVLETEDWKKVGLWLWFMMYTCIETL